MSNALRLEHRGIICQQSEVKEFFKNENGWQAVDFRPTAKELERCARSERATGLPPLIFIPADGARAEALIAAVNDINDDWINTVTMGDSDIPGAAMCAELMSKFQAERTDKVNGGRVLPCELANCASFWGRPVVGPGKVRVPYREVNMNGQLGRVEYRDFPAGAYPQVCFPVDLTKPTGRPSQCGERVIRYSVKADLSDVLSPVGDEEIQIPKNELFKFLMHQVLDLYTPIIEGVQYEAVEDIGLPYDSTWAYVGAYGHQRCASLSELVPAEAHAQSA